MGKSANDLISINVIHYSHFLFKKSQEKPDSNKCHTRDADLTAMGKSTPRLLRKNGKEEAAGPNLKFES